MNVGSFNVRNSYLGGYNKKDNPQIVSDIIKSEDFDLLGTQELTFDYEKKLTLDGYELYGGYRYGDMLKRLPFNESNGIITKINFLCEDTFRLPWVPDSIADLLKALASFSLMPRIATVGIILDKENRLICVVNTHLDYKIPNVQLKQLQALKKILDECRSQDFPIIMTGDFNMEPGNYLFDRFVKSIGDDGIMHIEIDDKTWHSPNGEDKTLDHIFISECFNVDDAGIISSKGTSDHEIVYAKVRLR